MLVGNIIKYYIAYKTNPFNAYSSVIASISSIRFVHYVWNNEARECQKPSALKSILFYLQVTNQFVFFFLTAIAFGLYFAYEKVKVGVLVPDLLLMIGFAYGVGYQISSLLYGEEVEAHVNQQAKMDRQFCEMLGADKPDGWNRRGILYFFSLMCNGTRPFVPYLILPLFLRPSQALSLYYRLGGSFGSAGWFGYGIWCAFNLGCAYSITNYYAILYLGHNYLTIFWLKRITEKISMQTSAETAETTHRVYRMLQLHNRMYFRPYSKLILPVVIFFASAWVVFSICCSLKLFNELSLLSLMMLSASASQAVGFLSVQFYSSHRMTCLSEEFLHTRRILSSNAVQKGYQRSYTILKIRVGTSYCISIDNMLTWSESMINYTILLLTVF